jgi:hypothetical protein
MWHSIRQRYLAAVLGRIGFSPVTPSIRACSHRDRVHSDARERLAEHQQQAKSEPVNIKSANAADIQLDVRDLGEIQLAYSTGLYDLHAHTGEPTYVLFGGWQTEQQLGFVAAIHAGGQTDFRISTEDRDGRDIHTELNDRIEQIIEHSQTHEATNQHEADRGNLPNPAYLALRQDHQPESEHMLATRDYQSAQEQNPTNDYSLEIE